jgi:hypothetical protein
MQFEAWKVDRFKKIIEDIRVARKQLLAFVYCADALKGVFALKWSEEADEETDNARI